MVSILKNTTKQHTVVSHNVRVGATYFSRLFGLMGKQPMELGESLWLKPCNNIHTMFMKFPIDVVFVDKNLVVKKIYKNIPPWRPLYVSLNAQSVFEFTAGSLKEGLVEIGDQLNVSD